MSVSREMPCCRIIILLVGRFSEAGYFLKYEVDDGPFDLLSLYYMSSIWLYALDKCFPSKAAHIKCIALRLYHRHNKAKPKSSNKTVPLLSKTNCFFVQCNTIDTQGHWLHDFNSVKLVPHLKAQPHLSQWKCLESLEVRLVNCT